MIRCLDLTSLEGQETEADILKLCQKAETSIGRVAAICIYPQFLNFAKAHVPTRVKLATVINFPNGSGSDREVLAEVKAALALGAEELDVVIPYHEVLQGHVHHSVELIEKVAAIAEGRSIKVILETGMIADARLIFRVSELLLGHGADFLKTSTGKVPIGATEEAVQAMLKALALHAQKTGNIKGLKVSGGVRTVAQAKHFMDLAETYFGASYLVPKTFRLGASSLLDRIVAEITPSENEVKATTY